MLTEHLLNLPPWQPRGSAEEINRATVEAMGGPYCQGDLEPDLVLTCVRNGAPVDLSDAQGYTMRWLKPNGTLVEDIELEDEDAATGKVKRVWIAGDTDVVGVHRAQVVVVAENGEVETFPPDGHFMWQVFAPLGSG